MADATSFVPSADDTRPFQTREPDELGDQLAPELVDV
jgi:hypothetical protein